MDRKLCPAGANSQQTSAKAKQEIHQMPSTRLINILFCCFCCPFLRKKNLTAKQRGSRHSEVLTILSKSSSPWVPTNSPCSCRPLFFFGLHRKRWTQLPVSLAILDAGHRSKSRQGCYRGCSNHRNLVILAAFLGGSRAVDVSTGGYFWYVYTNVFYSGNTATCSSLKLKSSNYLG